MSRRRAEDIAQWKGTSLACMSSRVDPHYHKVHKIPLPLLLLLLILLLGNGWDFPDSVRQINCGAQGTPSTRNLSLGVDGGLSSLKEIVRGFRK